MIVADYNTEALVWLLVLAQEMHNNTVDPSWALFGSGILSAQQLGNFSPLVASSTILLLMRTSLVYLIQCVD